MSDEFDELLNKFEKPKEEASPEEGKPLILFIDDDESMRRGLTSALSHKYKVLTAESGTKGVEILSKEVQCVILDVKMRELNGFSTYPKLKAKCPDVPIIFYTAFQSEHDLQEIINKYKPEGYEEKGKDISFLENLIENAVKKYKLILENEEYKKDLERKVEERTAQFKKQKDRAELALSKLKEMQEQIIELQTRKRQDKFLRASAHEIKNKINPISDYGNVIKRYTDFMPRLLEINNSLIKLFIAYANNPLTEETLENTFLPLINEVDQFFEDNGPERAIKAMGGLERALDNAFKRIEIIRNEARRRDPREGYVRGHEIICLNDLITFVEKDYEERMRQHDIRFIRRGDTQECLKGEWQHFYDILNNIVDNGLRHIVKAVEKEPDNAREFIIDVDKSDDQLKITMTDTGTGMTKEEKDGKVFDPFYTTNVGPDGEENGWGTGLGIVSDYVELYKGRIEIPFSEIGKGTTFVIYMPRVECGNKVRKDG